MSQTTLNPKTKSTTKNKLIDRLRQGTVLCAEGYLFELERRGYLKAGAYVPEVVLDNPEAVKQLHREFLQAGSDVIEAFTYYAHRDKLRVIGREDDLEPLNRQALRIAKEVAAEGDALVAGNICNTWIYDPKNKAASSKIVRAMYKEQVGWAADEGVDYVVAETIGHLGEALLALEVIREHGLPAVVTLAQPRKPGKTADGYDLVEACQILEQNGADVVGFNCNNSPETLLQILQKVRQAVECYTAALPVPYHLEHGQHFWDLEYNGRKAFPLSLDPFLCTRDELADFATQARDIGVDYIGICCGGAPHHVRAMAEALGRTPPASQYSADLSEHGTVINS